MNPKLKELLAQLNKIDTDNPLFVECIDEIYQTFTNYSKMNEDLRDTREIPFKRIAIIGWGLMGGSMAKWIKAKNKNTYLAGLSHPDGDTDLANNEGLIDKLYTSLHDLTKDVDLIILAVPLGEIIGISKAIANSVKNRSKKLTVMDIGSVKHLISKEFEQLTHSEVEFVATHPMAGSDKRGYSNSQATLFYKAWIITPHSANHDQTLIGIQKVIEFFGARSLSMDPSMHDKYVALISHLPEIISASYLKFVEEEDPKSLAIAGPGFRSFTRLAHSNPILRKDIGIANASWITPYLDKWVAFQKRRG